MVGGFCSVHLAGLQHSLPFNTKEQAVDYRFCHVKAHTRLTQGMLTG